VAFEQELEQESGMWPGVAPALEPVTGLDVPKWLNVLWVEAKRLAPAMMIRKNW
jgi:hypothetical protein